MAVSIVDIASPAGLKKYHDTDIGATKVSIDATSGNIHAITIDNTGNAAEATFLKLWNVASGSVTVGTTAPDYVFMVPAATKVTIVFSSAIAYDTALTVACVTTAGTAGTTDPTSSVVLDLIFET